MAELAWPDGITASNAVGVAEGDTGGRGGAEGVSVGIGESGAVFLEGRPGCWRIIDVVPF